MPPEPAIPTCLGKLLATDLEEASKGMASAPTTEILTGRDNSRAKLMEAFASARRYRQSGDLRHAERLYRHVLQLDAQHVEGWYLLGETCHGQGKHAEAARVYRHALQLRPDYVEALTGLGVTLAEQGRLEEAARHLQQAVGIRPDFAKARHNLGVCLAQQGRHEEAAHSLRSALQLEPDYAEASYNLGNVLMAQKHHAEAVAAYEEAVRLRPNYFEAYNNLGLELLELGRTGEAVVVLRQAARLRPRSAEAHNNLGLALEQQGRFAEAEASFEQALRLNPQYAEAHANLASTYNDQGRSEEALASYQQALRLQPNAASAHWNRALVWLQSGDFEHGWPEYEWRWQRKHSPPRPFPQPLWDGSPLHGRAILLHMEQGLGDMLQFIRYAPLVKRRGGRVIVECPPVLLSLFASCAGIDHLVPEGEPLPEFAVQAPLMSLPGLLGTTLQTIPAEVPYLSAASERIAYWRRQLASVPALKIGIAWQGNPRHRWDRHRSIPLVQFAPLARRKGVQLYSLQKGPGTDQLEALAGRFAVSTLTPGAAMTPETFMDTAAIMKNLDLVISTDTALAHLAGALAVPVWVALSVRVDWRWLRERTDSPWYPTMRLFRQQELGAWSAVFERMARVLSHARSGLRRGSANRRETVSGRSRPRS